jgi:hypothetical protein
MVVDAALEAPFSTFWKFLFDGSISQMFSDSIFLILFIKEQYKIKENLLFDG